MSSSHSRQCFNIAPRLGWILANTSPSLHSDDSLAVKNRLILMLQPHSLDNLEDECRQRAKARRLMAKSLEKGHENFCKCIEKPGNRGFFGDGSHHYRTEEEESLQPPVLRQETGRDRQGAPSWCFAHSDSPRPITPTTSLINNYRFDPINDQLLFFSTICRSAPSWQPRTPLRMRQNRTTASTYLVLFIRVLHLFLKPIGAFSLIE